MTAVYYYQAASFAALDVCVHSVCYVCVCVSPSGRERERVDLWPVLLDCHSAVRRFPPRSAQTFISRLLCFMRLPQTIEPAYKYTLQRSKRSTALNWQNFQVAEVNFFPQNAFFSFNVTFVVICYSVLLKHKLFSKGAENSFNFNKVKLQAIFSKIIAN